MKEPDEVLRKEVEPRMQKHAHLEAAPDVDAVTVSMHNAVTVAVEFAKEKVLEERERCANIRIGLGDDASVGLTPHFAAAIRSPPQEPTDE